jgi:hypothetical protein
MSTLLHLIWLPVVAAAATALVLALPGWARERSERSAGRRALTERLARVYEEELQAVDRRVPTPVGLPGQGSGWDDLPPDLAEDLSAAAEAFLAGSYRTHLEAEARVIPAWAWVNQLAHGTLDDIEALGARGLWATGPEAVVATVAANISRLVRRDGASLAQLQEQGLLRLEDRLAREVPDPADDAEVAHVLATVLHRWLDLPPDQG